MTNSLLHRIWKHRIDYLMISPFFIIFGIFHGYPLGWALWLSFRKWSGFGDPRWFGWGNYERLLDSSRFEIATNNTIIFFIVLLPLVIVLSLVLANILNSPGITGRSIFRAIFFLPYITSLVVAVIIFQLLFQDNFGWVNGVAGMVGIGRTPWLTEPIPARALIMIMFLWSITGYNVLIMLGGLQGIPKALYEAARVDGADIFQQFLHITIPMMRGVILFVAITASIAILNLFVQPWLLFDQNQGAGPDQSTMTLNTLQYRTAFSSFRYGEAAALGFIITVIVLVASISQIILNRLSEQPQRN